MKVLAKHKWVVDTIITESIDKKDESYRRFTATINGFRGWKIFEGYLTKNTIEAVKNIVKQIKDKIDNGEDGIFYHKGYFLNQKGK